MLTWCYRVFLVTYIGGNMELVNPDTHIYFLNIYVIGLFKRENSNKISDRGSYRLLNILGFYEIIEMGRNHNYLIN